MVEETPTYPEYALALIRDCTLTDPDHVVEFKCSAVRAASMIAGSEATLILPIPPDVPQWRAILEFGDVISECIEEGLARIANDRAAIAQEWQT